MWIFLTRQGLLSTKYESKVRKGGETLRAFVFFLSALPSFSEHSRHRKGGRKGWKGRKNLLGGGGGGGEKRGGRAPGGW